jgi:murein DD-endopeptidase MepM/ murein hydrolase activator NlpD
VQDSIINSLKQVPVETFISPSSRLENRLKTAQRSDGVDQKNELKKSAQDFEAIFIAQMLKVMRETIEESGLMDGEGYGKAIYTDMFDQEIALNMARQGTFGIADSLYENLSTLDKGTHDSPANEPAVVPASSQGTVHEISELHLPIQAPVSSGFGIRTDPFSQRLSFHKGLDLAAPEGTDVMAALPGKVISTGYESGYGNTVLLEHSGGLRTRYGHLNSINVKAGDILTSENVLGKVGSTGKSTGPHLHFEVIRMGKQVDPLQAAGERTAGLRKNFIDSRTGV